MAFQLCCQMGRYGMLVEIGKDHVFRFMNVGKLVYKACVRSGHSRRTADGSLVVACVIAGLPHGFHNQRRYVGFADIRVGAGNK